MSGPRIGFLFSGQGAPVKADAGALGERFPEAAGVYADTDLPPAPIPPERVQQAIVMSSLAALRVVRSLGIEAEVAIGHSLGELTALHWAGALDEDALVRAARARGAAMTEYASAEGAMASVLGGADAVSALLVPGAVIACFNAPSQHVVSGTVEAVDEVVARARALGMRALRLRVTGAFHSPLVADAVPVFEQALAEEALRPLERTVISTVTGAALPADTDLRALLARQITDPVRFSDALRAALPLDLLIEIGPGKILSGLARDHDAPPAVSIRAGDASLDGLLEVIAAAQDAGVPVVAHPLHDGAPAAAPGAPIEHSHADAGSTAAPRQ